MPASSYDPRSVSESCPVPGVQNAFPCLVALTEEGREKTFNIFQKVAIRKTIFAYILEKSALGKLGFFPSCPYDLKEAGNRGSKLPEIQGNMKSQQGEFSSPNSISCFVCFFFFAPSCQTFRDEPHQISFQFLFQNHAPVSLIPI